MPVSPSPRKRPVTQEDKRFTWHLKRLACLNVPVIRDIYESCKPSNRDHHQGKGLVYNRYLAAKFLLDLAEDLDTAKLNLYLDRTEGKVAEVLVTGSFEDLVHALEHGRQRLLTPQPAIEGELASLPIVVDSASPIAEESHPSPDSTESTPSK